MYIVIPRTTTKKISRGIAKTSTEVIEWNTKMYSINQKEDRKEEQNHTEMIEKKKKKTQQDVGLKPTISVITCKINKSNISIKGKDYYIELKKKQDPIICCL